MEIKSPAGIHYKRNVTHLQKYEEDKSQETGASNANWDIAKIRTRKLVRKRNSVLCVTA